jgi:hypothetical protein
VPWAAPDYEPTAAEIVEFLADWRSTMAEPGTHGNFRIVPTMAHLLWEIEGVFWGNRRVLDDGTIELDWFVPGPFECEKHG